MLPIAPYHVSDVNAECTLNLIYINHINFFVFISSVAVFKLIDRQLLSYCVAICFNCNSLRAVLVLTRIAVFQSNSIFSHFEDSRYF